MRVGLGAIIHRKVPWRPGDSPLGCVSLVEANMRREESYFEQQELVLVYIAKRLGEAKRVEKLLDARCRRRTDGSRRPRHSGRRWPEA